ncbi:MAG: peptide/nickel transport system ATP-binding protein [Chloroflexota bacterium]|jgi:oligopeptide/dipeptide ABC transporter ATP-binding protein|nr:peptide/nickel transport system ATP-binding protein [Chloroflexota bacterium]
MPDAGTLLQVSDFSVSYDSPRGPIRAVDEVSLSLPRGGALGIVGESGCGKSTLAFGLLRLLPENGRIVGGRVELAGVDLLGMPVEEFRTGVRWKRLAMVFQSAMNSLNPVMRVGTQLIDACLLHGKGMTRTQARERAGELFGLVGLTPSQLDLYPHEMSGGMRQRAVIALSLVARPDIVIADEATTGLDVLVQEQILRELNALRSSVGLSLIVVSHDIDVISKLCDEILVMYAGRVVETGRTAEVLARPRHPYTAALLAALPRLSGPRRRLITLPGTPPDLGALPRGCRFADRCPLVEQVCREVEPELPVRPAAARCHFEGDPRIDALARGAA